MSPSRASALEQSLGQEVPMVIPFHLLLLVVMMILTVILTAPLLLHFHLSGTHRILRSGSGSLPATAHLVLRKTPISQVRELRLREEKSLAQGHTAGQWH